MTTETSPETTTQNFSDTIARKYIYGKNGLRRGIIIAFMSDEEVLIGYSLCCKADLVRKDQIPKKFDSKGRPVLDYYFDKDAAMIIAEDRAYEIDDLNPRMLIVKGGAYNESRKKTYTKSITVSIHDEEMTDEQKKKSYISIPASMVRQMYEFINKLDKIFVGLDKSKLPKWVPVFTNAYENDMFSDILPEQKYTIALPEGHSLWETIAESFELSGQIRKLESQIQKLRGELKRKEKEVDRGLQRYHDTSNNSVTIA